MTRDKESIYESWKARLEVTSNEELKAFLTDAEAARWFQSIADCLPKGRTVAEVLTNGQVAGLLAEVLTETRGVSPDH